MRTTHDLQLVSEADAARRLAVSRRTLRRWVSADLIPSLRLGGRRLYDLRDLERLVAAAKTNSADVAATPSVPINAASTAQPRRD